MPFFILVYICFLYLEFYSYYRLSIKNIINIKTKFIGVSRLYKTSQTIK